MKKRLFIAVENRYVARWVADMLKDFSSGNEVEINLLITKQQKTGSRVLDRFLPPKLRKIFSKVDITGLFPVVSGDNSFPFLGMVSHQLRKLIPDTGNFPSKRLFLEKGNKISAGGYEGAWFFLWHFLALSSPLVIKDEDANCSYHAFFQVGSYSFEKNSGFLRFNIEKLLNQLIFAGSHGLPKAKSSDIQRGKLLKILKYPFWKFFQKYRERFLAPRWRLITMDIEALNEMKRINSKVISPPVGLEWADPMLADSNEGLFLFIEEEVNDKGHISVVRLNRETLSFTEAPQKIIEKPTHLSYPFVFRVGSDWYMIPESSEERKMTIYKSLQFPLVWVPVRNVFENEQWVDTTPFFHDGKWWIFSVKKRVDYASSYQDLFLFYSNDIINGEWHSHPKNPVVSDVRHARPAGAVFSYRGKLFRPAQNCLHKYGGSLMLCEIIRLTDDDYEEQICGEFLFPWYSKLSSFHTIAVYNDRLMGDCYY
ncbi:MAG: hypothetical protein PWQ17_364 [Anaerophaga sp.]|nr:hypothetical protein [Anaerophaga sp.]